MRQRRERLGAAAASTLAKRLRAGILLVSSMRIPSTSPARRPIPSPGLTDRLGDVDRRGDPPRAMWMLGSQPGGSGVNSAVRRDMCLG